MTNLNDSLGDLIVILDDNPISDWGDIPPIFSKIQAIQHEPLPVSLNQYLKTIGNGTAFLTFEFGIDGVSIEILKYARVLESIYDQCTDARLHFIAGDFAPQADMILKSRWSKYQIKGTNGWAKWDGGRWFNALFFEDMVTGSQRSSEVAINIYRQAKIIAKKLGDYIATNEIKLLIPVNVASNPGNMSLTLALVFVTEALGTIVINSNHDYFWDGGKPAGERKAGEEPGMRDHFFHNIDNLPFYSLFSQLYPWNGRRWLQVNINNRQSERLIKEYGFQEDKVFKINTCVREELFEDYRPDDVRSARLRMGYILSDGAPELRSISLKEHQSNLQVWMGEQHPRVIGARNGLILDPTAANIIYLLQPTRVIARKRIEKGVELIHSLLNGPMRKPILQEPNQQIVLHITGPTPVEHQSDLEVILQAYQDLIEDLPESISDRVFLAFSGGRESHPSFSERGFTNLNIIEIYRMATAILFPSESEGRGLPIIESGAVGIPIICSRYQPEEVFADVIGEELPEDQQIRYFLFPEGDFSDDFLEQVANVLLRPEHMASWRKHNRQVIRSRFSEAALRDKFQALLNRSYQIASRSESGDPTII